jgi:hypothetical protein
MQCIIHHLVYVLWHPTEHKQDDILVGQQRTMRTITCDSLLEPLP